MKVIGIKTEREKAWSLFKVIDKHNDGIEEIDNSNQDYVAVRFRLKPVLWSDKLGEFIFMRAAKRALL